MRMSLRRRPRASKVETVIPFCALAILSYMDAERRRVRPCSVGLGLRTWVTTRSSPSRHEALTGEVHLMSIGGHT